jgi:hypothetical protein
LEQREQILKVDEVFRRLVGRRWITDRKTGERRMGVFWAAFETRKENDRKGITAARKKEREEAAKREAAFKKAAEEIIGRGGFVAEARVVKKGRGTERVVVRDKVAVLLQKGKSKKGNEYWEVVELVTAAQGKVEEAYGLRVGHRSTLDMGQFVEWLREGAKPYFVMRGEDFIERLTYEK